MSTHKPLFMDFSQADAFLRIMKPHPLRFWLLNSFVLYALLSCNQTAAQIVPDATLPVNSIVTPQGNTSLIEGGTTRGTNLFHSFKDFSIPTDGTAFFNNALNIQNIFTRVTGGSISNIDGLIKANGTANLFLLNPNGILFGANARLNIGGSFVASTANSINFADSTLFSATAPQATPLLTISVPVGLQFGQNPGSISVQGTGYDLSNQTPYLSPVTIGNSGTGLRVSSGKTLALVGGDVDIEGSTLTAKQGQIELGSVRDGQVILSSTSSGFALSYQDVQGFGDIHLSQQALVDTSGSPGGSIQVQGNQVSLADGSLIFIQNQGSQPAGRLSVNAVQSLDMSGSSPDGRFYGGLRSETLGSGRGADTVVSTRQLVIQDASAIAARSYSSGKAGDVTVSASDSVLVAGFSPIYTSRNSTIASDATSFGDAGNVTVSTRQLTLLNGGAVGSQTTNTGAGAGKGGDVTVNATESVELTGSTGFKVSNVFALTGGPGDAGNATINTSRLALRDGGSIVTITVATGNAGSLTLNATEAVEVSGSVLLQTGQIVPSQVSASANSVASSRLKVPLSGATGDVTITTGKLSVTDGAKVDVSHQGIGNAGKLKINANSIFLDNQGSITAATASGAGGDINLQAQDLLVIRHNSEITATAGGTGNGGNINIDTPLLVAIPNENSDIRADSVGSRGGNVTINTQGIFGIQFRNQDTLGSDITATGRDSSLNGTVQINIERVNPTSGLVELPTTVVDASRLIAQGCPASSGNSFVVSGRGGLPPTPQQALGDDPGWQDWRSVALVRGQLSTRRASRSTPHQSVGKPSVAQPLVEANGWVIGSKGEVILTATTPNVTPHSPWQQPANCHEL